jgi:hypothetical protein
MAVHSTTLVFKHQPENEAASEEQENEATANSPRVAIVDFENCLIISKTISSRMASSCMLTYHLTYNP